MTQFGRLDIIKEQGKKLGLGTQVDIFQLAIETPFFSFINSYEQS